MGSTSQIKVVLFLDRLYDLFYARNTHKQIGRDGKLDDTNDYFLTICSAPTNRAN